MGVVCRVGVNISVEKTPLRPCRGRIGGVRPEDRAMNLVRKEEAGAGREGQAIAIDWARGRRARVVGKSRGGWAAIGAGGVGLRTAQVWR